MADNEDVNGLVCSECSRTLKNRREMLLHQNEHKRKQKLVCPECNKPQRTELTMKRHLRAHGRQKKVRMCHICMMKFPTAHKLEEHHRNEHMTEKVFVCNICGAEFSWQQNFWKHFRMHEVENLNVSSSSSQVCSYCGMVFIDATSLRIHLQKHNRDNERPIQPEASKESYTCEICNRTFQFDFSYEAHMNAHANRPSNSQQSAGDLKATETRYVEVGSDGILQMDDLNKRTDEEELINPHMVQQNLSDTQTGLTSFKGTVDRTRKSNIRIMQIANGISTDLSPSIITSVDDTPRSYSVNRIRKPKRPKRVSIPFIYDLVMTDEKPFVCNVCGASFRWNISLDTHMRDHVFSDLPPRPQTARRRQSGRPVGRRGRGRGRRMVQSRIVQRNASSDEEANDEYSFKSDDGDDAAEVIRPYEQMNRRAATLPKGTVFLQVVDPNILTSVNAPNVLPADNSKEPSSAAVEDGPTTSGDASLLVNDNGLLRLLDHCRWQQLQSTRRQVLICRKCRSVFTNRTSWMNHTVHCHNKVWHRCQYCGRNFPTSFTLVVHQCRGHYDHVFNYGALNGCAYLNSSYKRHTTKLSRWSCQFCFRYFFRQDRCVEHAAEAHAATAADSATYTQIVERSQLMNDYIADDENQQSQLLLTGDVMMQ